MLKHAASVAIAATFAIGAAWSAGAGFTRPDFMTDIAHIRNLPEANPVTVSGVIRSVYKIDGITVEDGTGEVDITLDTARNDLRPGYYVVVQGYVDDADFLDFAEIDHARILHVSDASYIGTDDIVAPESDTGPGGYVD